MGQPYLSTPIKTKEVHEGSNNRYSYAAVAMQGWRNSMEDAHITNLNFDGEDKAIFGVFDGHGGKQMAIFVQSRFIDELMKCSEYKNGDYKTALENTFLRMDELARLSENKVHLGEGTSGCTANVVLIVGKKIYCANSGDSRSIMMKGGKAVALSEDHKPQSIIEQTRIEKAGGSIIQGRINGNLNLSRALGDLEYKVNDANPSNKNPKEYMITAFPDVTVNELSNNVTHIVLGCDGIWECKSNQYIGEYFGKTLNNIRGTAENFLDSILAPGVNTSYGLDNMSVIIVRVKS